MTPQHATVNLENVENMAPKYGMGEICESRFFRKELGAERIGMSHFKMNPGRRIGFGHRHEESEEIYVILEGSGRFKIEDEIIAVSAKDVVYLQPGAMREWEAGPDGMEMLVFGAHAENDSDIQRGWWTD